MKAFDCAIIGAGPAGMSAAIELAQAGIDVVVLDRAGQPGGQIYRSASNSPLPNVTKLGPDYAAGAELITRFEKCGATFLADADAWHLGDDGHILFPTAVKRENCTAARCFCAPVRWNGRCRSPDGRCPAS